MEILKFFSFSSLLNNWILVLLVFVGLGQGINESKAKMSQNKQLLQPLQPRQLFQPVKEKFPSAYQVKFRDEQNKEVEFILRGKPQRRKVRKDPGTGVYLYRNSQGQERPLSELLKRLGSPYFLVNAKGEKILDLNQKMPIKIKILPSADGQEQFVAEFLLRGRPQRRFLYFDKGLQQWQYLNSSGVKRPLTELHIRLGAQYYWENFPKNLPKNLPKNPSSPPQQRPLTPPTQTPFHWDHGGMAIPRLISQRECEELSFDNRRNMADDTDQKKSSLCWAHATSGIIEEQLCLANPQYCGEKVARTEVAAHAKEIDFIKAITNAGTIVDPLSFYIKPPPEGGGYQVCLDKYAKNPFDLGDKKFLEDLQRTYVDMKGIRLCPDRPLKALSPEIEENLKKLIDFMERDKALQSVSPLQMTRLNLERIKVLAQESSTEGEFMKKVLLFYCETLPKKNFQRALVNLCIQNKDFPASRDLTSFDLRSYLQEFQGAKNAGHSLILGICYNPLVDKIKSFSGNAEVAAEIDPTKDCGGHAIVANALTWDKQTGRCLLYGKNSHGEKALLPSGWYPAELIFAHTIQTSFYGKRKWSDLGGKDIFCR